MPLLSGLSCARCGDHLDNPLQNHCRSCRLAPPPFERAVSYTVYQDRMREAIHALKYGHMRPAARRMGAMLAQAIAELHGEAPDELLVIPVPLHPSRHAQRGFNQARSLATHAIRALRGTHPDWNLTLADHTLLRHRVTESQARLTPRQRRVNLRGAFAVSDKATIAGRHVLLIDDILTTGATARSAAATLRRAGAASVRVATLARARRIHTVGHDDPHGSTQDKDVLLGQPGEPEETHSYLETISLRGH